MPRLRGRRWRRAGPVHEWDEGRVVSSGKSLVFRADDLAAATEGEMVAGQSGMQVGGFSIDSRRVQAGDLFLAIRGARFDGHRFVSEAVHRGAAGVVVSDASSVVLDTSARDVPFVIIVRDTIRALQFLARFVRRRSNARVVAITGSVGKTTTKDIVAALLASKYRVCRNEGNLNNHIGLPLSLLELVHGAEIAVVELGMNHAGEIRTLVGIAEPEMRVWTNVAEVHSAFFDSIDAIADAKAEILEAATPDSQLVANAGDPHVMARTPRFPGRLTTFGIEADADVNATQVRGLGLGGMEAVIHTPKGSSFLQTPLLGYGQVANIVAAIAVALQFDVPLDVVMARVAAFPPQPRRGEVIRLRNITVVDDTYNSNPTALKAALEAVGRDKSCARRIAILGEMLELGAESTAQHEACGRAAVEAGFDVVVGVGGEPVAALAGGAMAAGLSATAVVTFATSSEAAGHAVGFVQAGDLVLVKGSRGIGMDRIVDRLRTEQ